MTEIILALMPFIIGSALELLQIIMVLLLLKNPNQGLLKAMAFVLGMSVIRLLQWVIFGQVLAGSAEGEAGGKGPVASTLMLTLGLLLLISAYKKWKKEPDPDEPPPAWLAKLDHASAAFALGIGALLPLISPKQWVFTLSAINTIDAKQMGQGDSTLAYLLFLLLAQSLLILSILVRILLPSQSKSLLQDISAWLNRNNRAIMIVVSLVFGLYFLYNGVTGLLS